MLLFLGLEVFVLGLGIGIGTSIVPVCRYLVFLIIATRLF